MNHSDSSQYIRELKDQIEELKTEVRARDTGAGTQIKHEARRVREEGRRLMAGLLCGYVYLRLQRADAPPSPAYPRCGC